MCIQKLNIISNRKYININNLIHIIDLISSIRNQIRWKLHFNKGLISHWTSATMIRIQMNMNLEPTSIDICYIKKCRTIKQEKVHYLISFHLQEWLTNMIHIENALKNWTTNDFQDNSRRNFILIWLIKAFWTLDHLLVKEKK